MKPISMDKHEKYMRLAIEVARLNPRAAFGTVLVDHECDQVVAQGINHVSTNPILHGEIDAIMRYSEEGGNRWAQLSLYTTAEPCCMCQAAIIWCGIPHVVYGTAIATLVELGWSQFDMTAQDVSERATFAQCTLAGGVLEKECDELFVRLDEDR